MTTDNDTALTDEDTRTLHVATDRAGRTWRLLEREDGSFSVYYSTADDPPRTKRVLWDTADYWSDPPRVLLARAERAEAKARILQRACEEALAIAESKRPGTWDDVMQEMRTALKEVR